jgi:hypothetical protein
VPRKVRSPNFGPVSSEIKIAARVYHRLSLARALDSLMLDDTKQEFDLAAELLQKEVSRRFEVLFDHYNIRKDLSERYLLLSFALATEFVPNFSPYKSYGRERGRPKSVSKHIEMVKEVDKVRAEKPVSLIQACRILTKRNGPWKGKRPSDLQAAYYRVRKADLPLGLEMEIQRPLRKTATEFK